MPLAEFNKGYLFTGRHLEKTYSEDEIMSQPMVYGGSWDWMRDNGGTIANDIMDVIRDNVIALIPDQAMKGYHPVIDTKVVQLMQGQYPCIPGWHCDGVIRAARGSQPNMATLNQHVMHYICSVSTSEYGGTEVSTNPLEVEYDPDNVWGSVSNELLYHQGEVLKSGQIAQFTRDRLHRGTPATERCWRYFFRLSFYHMPAMNEFRKQVQVYTDVNGGW